MSFPNLLFSKSQINKAGETLIQPHPKFEEILHAFEVISNWRACHGYPMNTFQVTLRRRLKSFDSAIGAERLKRIPSIIDKLRLQQNMQLSRMQDIGGLRAVVKNMDDVNRLKKIYLSDKRVGHKLTRQDNYITKPKLDGYRSIHLIYKYFNNKNHDYDGLLIELQIRTKFQHIWATAVETMGTYLGQKLKSGQGDAKWREFFLISSAAFTYLEKTPKIPQYNKLNKEETYHELIKVEKELNALHIMRNYGLALKVVENKIGKANYYHLIILNSLKGTVAVKSYPKNAIQRASKDYLAIEKRIQNGEQIETVLVSAGDFRELKKAYPNYFFDMQGFIKNIEKIIQPRVSKN